MFISGHGSYKRALVITALLIGCAFQPALAQDDDHSLDSIGIDWVAGPDTADIGKMAKIKVPESFIFADGDGTRIMLELSQNPTDGSEQGMIGPEDLDWFVVFEWDDCGYVKDDERADLDADAILDSIREGTEQGNAERRRRGWPTMEILGWEQEPQYDAKSNNLAWAVRAESEGDLIVNYNTRRLGRRGVMLVTLVTDPEKLPAVQPEFEKLMAGFSFSDGSRYGDFTSGDKIAQYGLTALITGGAAAVAVKTGLFKWLWKLIVIAAVGVAGIFKAIFKGRRE